MEDRNDSSGILWFVAGVAIGTTMGILFAPHSGEETRRRIGSKAKEGRDRLQDQGRALMDRGRDMYDRGGMKGKKALALASLGGRPQALSRLSPGFIPSGRLSTRREYLPRYLADTAEMSPARHIHAPSGLARLLHFQPA